mgnify:CR=1 FL=1
MTEVLRLMTESRKELAEKTRQVEVLVVSLGQALDLVNWFDRGTEHERLCSVWRDKALAEARKEKV